MKTLKVHTSCPVSVLPAKAQDATSLSEAYLRLPSKIIAYFGRSAKGAKVSYSLIA